MTYTFVDCQGFAGGAAVGATLAGLRLVGKLEQRGGFGVPTLEANRAFLGDTWQAQVGDPAGWQPVACDVLVGTPPCAAFSGMSVGTPRHGISSDINDCMWELFRYAARVRPQVVVMESVSQAYTVGLPLMRSLVTYLNEATVLAYQATHVLQDNHVLGGCTRRKRYFLVASRVPFGVEGVPYRPATIQDALGDLVAQPLGWEAQPYVAAPTWWSEPLRNPAGQVDGHAEPESNFTRRVHDLTDPPAGVPWYPGDRESDVLRRYYEVHGELPESWRYKASSRFGLGHLTRDKQLIERNFQTGGFSQPKAWHWHQPGFVLNGAGPYQVWHPNGRFLTHREAARVLGFPDAWRIEPLREVRGLHSYWGKGTSVHPARWILTWVARALDGAPGGNVGVPLDGGDRLVDVSRAPKPSHLTVVTAPTVYT